MDITPIIPAGRQLIEAYGDAGFTVSGTRYSQAVLVLPHATLPLDGFSFDAPDVQSLLETLTLAHTELLLLGCGKQIRPLPLALREALKRARISVEAMDTGAACRTYNVLMAESRNVAAVLYIN